MKVRLDDLDERIRALVLRRLGTFFRAPLDREFLKSLPRKLWLFQIPNKWDIGEYEWEGHDDAKALHKRYEARAAGGVFAHIVGVGLLVSGAILSGLGVLPPMGEAFMGASLPILSLPWLLQWQWRRRLRREVTREELSLALAEEQLSDVEHMYVAVLDEAMRKDEDPGGERDVRRILRSCAEVVERYRELEGMLGALPDRPSEAAIRRAEEEAEQVKKEIEQEADPFILSAHRDRVQSLESTVESLRQVGALSRRVEAQMRAIEAMLSGARASLTRLRLSHGTTVDEDTGALIERLNRLAIETSSLEKAIVEVRQITEGL